MATVKWSAQKFIDTIKPYIDDSLKNMDEENKKSKESFNKLFPQPQMPEENNPGEGQQ